MAKLIKKGDTTKVVKDDHQEKVEVEENNELTPIVSAFVEEFKAKTEELRKNEPQKENFITVYVTKKAKVQRIFKITDFRDHMDLFDEEIIKKNGFDLDAIVLTNLDQFLTMCGYTCEFDVDEEGYTIDCKKFADGNSDFWDEVAIFLGNQYNPSWSEKKAIEFVYHLRRYAMGVDLYRFEVLYAGITKFYNED